jgi:hypothetical protein
MKNNRTSEANTTKNAINEAGFYQYFENGMLYCPNDLSDSNDSAIRIFRKTVSETFDLNEAYFQKDLELTYNISSSPGFKTIMLDFMKDLYFLPLTVGTERARFHEDSALFQITYGDFGCIVYIKATGTAFIQSKTSKELHNILDGVLTLYEENGSIVDLVGPSEEDECDEEEFFNDNF